MPSFQDFGLSQTTLEALAAKNITEPTPIQAEAIPLLLNGTNDVLGQARTGTGKTAAFGIPIIERIHPGGRAPQAIVLTPTRELCMQVAAEIKSLAGTRRLFVAAVYGGASIEVQLRALNKGVDIVVGTPGRVQDMIDRGALDLDSIMFAVLDEADEMLDMGFVDDIEAILGRIPDGRRMLMFSATMPPEIMNIARRFMHDMKVVRVDAEPAKLEQTERYGYLVRREDKVEALVRLIRMNPDMYALVFCRTREDVDELCEILNIRHCHVDALHGEISQAQRTKVINLFKKQAFRILIATDVAARGIDVNGLTHVINFSLPETAETYIHRIGRTGRAGKNGVAITFVTPGERRKLKAIEDELGTKLEFRELPSPEALAASQRENLRARFDSVTPLPESMEFASALLETYSPASLVAKLLESGFGKTYLASSYAPIGRPPRERREGGERKKREFTEHEHNGSFARLFVSKGRSEGMTPAILLEMIYDAVRITSRRLGKINCYSKNSYIEVPVSLAKKIISGVNGHTHSTLLRFADPKRDKD